MDRLDRLKRKALGLLGDERGQAMTETIILVALVGLSLAWLTWALPTALSNHYRNNRDVLAAPL
jgi:hypothetical protein